MSRDHPPRGGEFRAFYFRLPLEAATMMARQTREQVSMVIKWHLDLPVLIVNDVVATESHFLN